MKSKIREVLEELYGMAIQNDRSDWDCKPTIKKALQSIKEIVESCVGEEKLTQIIQNTTNCHSYINDSCDITNQDIAKAFRQQTLENIQKRL